MPLRRKLVAVLGRNPTGVLTALLLAEEGHLVEVYPYCEAPLQSGIRQIRAPLVHTGLLLREARDGCASRLLWSAAYSLSEATGLGSLAGHGLIRHASSEAAEAFRQHARSLDLLYAVETVAHAEVRTLLGQLYQSNGLYDRIPDVPLPVEDLLHTAERQLEGAGVALSDETVAVERSAGDRVHLVTSRSQRRVDAGLVVVCCDPVHLVQLLDDLGVPHDLEPRWTSMLVLDGCRDMSTSMLIDLEAGLRVVRLSSRANRDRTALAVGPCDSEADPLDHDELMDRLLGSPLGQLLGLDTDTGWRARQFLAFEPGRQNWVFQPESLLGIIFALPGHDTLAMRAAEQIVALSLRERVQLHEAAGC